MANQYFAIPYLGASGLPMNNPSFTGQIEGPNGTAGAPTYSFTNAPTFGMYYDGTKLGLAASGSEAVAISSTLLSVPNGGVTAYTNLTGNQIAASGYGISLGTNSAYGLAIYGNATYTSAYSCTNPYAGGPSFILQGQLVVTKTANYSVTFTDNGVTFTNTGATGTVTFTLPASPYTGQMHRFMASAAQTITVTGTQNVCLPGLTAGTSRSTSVQFASAVFVYDGTQWVGAQSGTWT